jgi:magnesium transporter
MLNTFKTAFGGPTAQGDKSVWIDLLTPTPDETARVAAECGIQVPSREALQEVETSSRLRAEGRVLYVSMPLALQDPAAGFAPLPLGFILSPELLVTVRYSEVHAFTVERARVVRDPHVSSTGVFVLLVEGIVDFCADTLENVSGDLAAISASTFGGHENSARGKRATYALRESLRTVGSAGDHLSRIRESLLGLQRLVGFVSEMAVDWLAPDLQTRLKSARQDLGSLVDFEAHLSGKTQFLLDAILGFINTEQNEIFKVLTIVSVVGIPPTLIASMYGMNFHNMPELGWRWGYQYGLTLIVLSILLPILWFKRRGWW